MGKPKMLGIINYRLGNIGSIVRAFEFLDTTTQVVDTSDDLLRCDGLVLPGVGAFGDGMANFRASGLSEALGDFVKTGRPVLGICLGMQMLLSGGEEFGSHRGLDFITGEVRRLPEGLGQKIPRVGWYSLKPKDQPWAGSILSGLKPLEDDVYFVHSYAVYPAKTENILALASFGEHDYCSVVEKDNLVGVQFHPEKSGEVGLQILRNFLKKL